MTAGQLRSSSSGRWHPNVIKGIGHKMYVMPVEHSGGAIVFIAGKFTPEEMREIEALRRYEHKPLKQEVASLVANTAVDLQAKGVSATHHMLERTKKPKSPADKKWWQFWK